REHGDLERGVLLELAHPESAERIAQARADVEPAWIGVLVQRHARANVIAAAGVGAPERGGWQAGRLPAPAILDEDAAGVRHRRLLQGAGTARRTAAVNARPSRPRCSS